MRSPTPIAVIAGVMVSSTAVAVEAYSFSLDILWSTPITAPAPAPIGKVYSPEYGTGLVLRTQAIFPDGRIAFLGEQLTPNASSPVLLIDPERGVEGIINLKLRGAPPARGPGVISRLLGNNKPFVSALTIGAGGEIWVGGISNTYTGVTSYAHSDAYLARLDLTGRTLWEKSYGDGARRSIKSITWMPSGDLAVTGADRWDGWLARIAPDGRSVWESHMGNDQGNAIASLPDNRLIVVGFESTGSGVDYRDHVIAWIINESGNILAQTRIRNSINRFKGSHFGKVSVAATADAIYVASIWEGIFDAQPIEVSKLQLDGSLLWSRLLPDTTKAIPSRAWKSCPPALAVTPRGDAVIACSLESQIHLYQLDGSSGRYHETYFPLPDCQSGGPASLFLAVRDERSMILSGSRPGGTVAASCTWVGRLTATP